MAAVLAVMIVVPLAISITGRTEITPGFIAGAALFLPLFVFLPSLLQRAMKVDIDATIEAWGKNEQVKNVFWTFFIGMGEVVLPATTQQGIRWLKRAGLKMKKHCGHR